MRRLWTGRLRLCASCATRSTNVRRTQPRPCAYYYDVQAAHALLPRALPLPLRMPASARVVAPVHINHANHRNPPANTMDHVGRAPGRGAGEHDELVLRYLAPRKIQLPDRETQTRRGSYAQPRGTKEGPPALAAHPVLH